MAKIPANSLQSNPDNGVIGITYLIEGERGEHYRVQIVVGLFAFFLRFCSTVLLHSLFREQATLYREGGADM